MKSTIGYDQNSASQLERLAAQAALYSKAKYFLTVRFVSAMVLGLAAAFLYPYPQTRIYLTVSSFVLLAINSFVLKSSQAKTQRQAALIQEQFDSEVFHLPWNEVHCGQRPMSEEVIELAFKQKNVQMLKDWYPPVVDSLPIEQARIICQRTNLNWDFLLRRKYTKCIVSCLFVFVMAVFLFGLYGEISFEAYFVGICAPLFPIIAMGYEYAKSLTAANDRVSRLIGGAEHLWTIAFKNSVSANDLTMRSRELQNEIYDHRTQCPLVFDWIYSRFRSNQEHASKVTAERLVQESRTAISSRDAVEVAATS